MLASLNHPNIAAIHGLEHEQGRQALVLELVDGPTLADRIATGALPLDEALSIARQLADALEVAHEQGIVHRDLKPANIKLRPDGTAKVLDFGLAKALSRADDGSGLTRRGAVDVTASPTLLSPATMTSAGVILGTAAYMAPEQARGKTVDRRADIWAFGCVVYEMIAGRRAFAGDEITDTLAGILRGDPEWDALPPSTPRAIRRLLRRCLEKDPRQRLQAIGDARLEIADALAPGAGDTVVPAVAPAPRGISIVPLVVASAASALLAGAAIWALKPPAQADTPVVTRALLAIDPFEQRPTVRPGETRGPVGRPDRTAIALSPDGRTLVFRAIATEVNPGGGTQSVLFIRRLDSLMGSPIPATTGSDSPFFSPAGDWIGYWDAGELRRVPAADRSAAFTTITRVPDGERVKGASWGDGDVVVFATGQGLWRVAASGGTPERISDVRPDETARILPHVLPGGQAMLFTRQKTSFRWDDAEVIVRPLGAGDEKVLLTDAADARYVRTGHLVFVRRGKLMAVPFDIDALELRGAAVAVVDDVMQAVNMSNSTNDSGAAQVAIAANGTLVYITGGVQPEGLTEVVWVDRSGKAEVLPLPAGGYGSPRLSPDGQRLLVFSGASAGENGNRLWHYDIARKTRTALTTREERILWGIWSPDGSRVVFQNSAAGRGTLHAKAADGTGKSEPIAEARPAFQTPSSWSRTGKLAFVESSATTGADIRVLDMTGSDRSGPVAVQTPADDSFPAFSPDGEWLAYASNASGAWEVYVQPHPGPGQRILVSTGGGQAPAWKGDGTELYYSNISDGVVHMMAVPLAMTASGLTAGTPRQMFTGEFGMTGPARGYDVSADGQRFLFVRRVATPPPPPSRMVVVENWAEELKNVQTER